MKNKHSSVIINLLRYISDNVRKSVSFISWATTAWTIDQLDSPMLVEFYIAVVKKIDRNAHVEEELLAYTLDYLNNPLTQIFESDSLILEEMVSDLPVIVKGPVSTKTYDLLMAYDVIIDMWHLTVAWRSEKIKEKVVIRLLPFPIRWKLGISR